MLKRIIYSLHGNVYSNLGLFDIAIIHIKYCRLDAKGIILCDMAHKYYGFLS